MNRLIACVFCLVIPPCPPVCRSALAIPPGSSYTSSVDHEHIKIFLLILAAAGVCVALHVLIGDGATAMGATPRRARRPQRSPSLLPPDDRLAGQCLRTAIWLGYYAFLVDCKAADLHGIRKASANAWSTSADHMLQWLLSFGINHVVVASVTIFPDALRRR